MDRPRRVFLLGLTFAVLTSAQVLAQVNLEVTSGIEFNFANPGARSLALGGAFLGLADDATAAFSNPAGLINLSKPEFSVEGRHWNYRTEYLNGGGPRLTPYTPSPLPSPGDAPMPFVYARTDDKANGISFASFVFPFKNWALAVYRHEQAHFVANASIPKTYLGIFPGVDQNGNSALFRFYLKPVTGREDLRITNIGGAVAFRLGETLSLGAGVVASQSSQKIKDTRYDINTGAPSVYDSAREEQTKVTYNVGLLWKPSRLVSIGAVYRHGPTFDLSLNVTDGNGVSFSGYPCQKCAVLHVPDVYGLGVSVHPTDFLTLSADYDNVQYSQLTDKYTVVYFPDGGTPGDFSKGFKAKNADEIHFGVQYNIPVGSSVISLRAGLWHDPAHGVRFTAPTIFEDQSVIGEAEFTGGKSQMHYSGGLGLVLGQHIQVDLGYDSAPSIRTASASLVVRF